MPLFRRGDGDPIPGLTPVRRLMPYLMRGRNESVVYHEQVVDVERALEFIADWNRTRAPRLTLFTLVVAACGRALHERPGLNRFVAGGRIYQRRGVFLSFAAKQRFTDEGGLITVKLPIAAGEPLDETARRMAAAVGEGRASGDGHDANHGGDGHHDQPRKPRRERPVDREVRLLNRLPGAILSLLVGLARLLDRWNLLPAALWRDDPMYASMFLANLGSVGIDRTWHHLYEYGTVSLFGVLGPVRKTVVAGDDDRPVVRRTVSIRWSFDERINDGFYCAASLDRARRFLEDPTLLVAPGPSDPAASHSSPVSPASGGVP